MKKYIVFIFSITLLSCSTKLTPNDEVIGASQNNRVSIDSLYCPINHTQLSIYNVSSNLWNQGNKIDEQLFYKLFQEIATERTWGENNQIIPALKHTNEYLLTKHNIDDKYDFVTLLKKDKKRKVMYWLSYHSKDSILKMGDETIKFGKGKLTNHGILSEKYKNDTISFKCFTKLVESNRVIKTSITYNVHNNSIDSTISFQELTLHPFHDGFKALEVGRKQFLNGKLIDNLWDHEVEWIKNLK